MKVGQCRTDLHHLLIRGDAYIINVFLDLPDLDPGAHFTCDLGEVGRDIS